MKRIASVLTGLSIAVLFFVASAHAQYDEQRMTANIPFEFTVSNVSFPAGQYEFLRAGANIFQIRNSSGRSAYAVASAPVQGNGLVDKSGLKFAVVDGHHVLVQIWNQRADMGNEFNESQPYEEVAKYPAIHGSAAGRR